MEFDTKGLGCLGQEGFPATGRHTKKHGSAGSDGQIMPTTTVSHWKIYSQIRGLGPFAPTRCRHKVHGNDPPCVATNGRNNPSGCLAKPFRLPVVSNTAWQDSARSHKRVIGEPTCKLVTPTVRAWDLNLVCLLNSHYFQQMIVSSFSQ